MALSDITLYSVPTPSTDIVLRAFPIAAIASTVLFLSAFDATPTTIILRDTTVAPGGGGSFPYTQFQGLRVYYGGAVRDLCLVAASDPMPADAKLRIRKGGTDYAIYLVDTADSDASHVRVRSGGTTKAIRLYT